MKPYGNFQSDVLESLKKLNDEMEKEEGQQIPDKNKIFKLRYQTLLKGMELSVPYTMIKHKPYI
jgi:hypothetical protein